MNEYYTCVKHGEHSYFYEDCYLCNDATSECDNQNNLKEEVNKLTDRVSMIESISADRITELEKIVIELDDRIRKLENRNSNFY